jgi:hypothetical protein
MTGRYGLTPSGCRDTYATSRMRAGLRTAPPPPTPADVWAGLPQFFRQWLACECFGGHQRGRGDAAWADLSAQERAALGARLRAVAGALV